MLMETDMVNEMFLVRVKEDRLMANKAAEFRTTIADFVEAGNTKLVLDLSEVKFLDSSGLGAIVSIRKMVGTGGSLVLCGLTEQVRSVFRLTRMDTVFEIFEDATLEQAA